MRILLINQFIPPDPAPTARLLGDVAAVLGERGHEIVLLGCRSDYRGSKTLLGSRHLRELNSLLQLLISGWFTKSCDRVVCLTSPPLLPVVAALIRLRHPGSELIHWAMDLYPDVAVALGEIREGSRLHRITSWLMGLAYRACSRVIVLDRDMAERVGNHGVQTHEVLPWPPSITLPPEKDRLMFSDGNGAENFTWLYSGNLGRAHEWRTLLYAQKILEDEGEAIELIFQGGGNERDAAKNLAGELGLTRCRWLPYAEDAGLIPSLLAADCLVATMRPSVRGCLWPSKLALATLLDRDILWVGSTAGSIAEKMRRLGHACFEAGDAEGLALRLKALVSLKGVTPKIRVAPEDLTARIASVRTMGINSVAGLILGD